MKFLRPYSNLCLYTLLILMCLYLYGCPEFESINQPSSVSPGEIFTVFIEASSTIEDVVTVVTAPYFGIRLPQGWTIPGDAITCTGVYNEVITYDPNLALEQEALSPSPEGYYWWVGDGNGADVEGSVYGEIQIQTSGQLGLFSIDYMLGNSHDGLNLHRSNNHLIYIVDEYTPRGLQAAFQGDSVLLSWVTPHISEQIVGYNVYRDGQLIDTIPDEDTEYTDEGLPSGVFNYSVSAVYEDGQEHLTPYEVRGLVFSGGTGEPNEPYQIASAEQLVCIADFPTLTDKSFVLINNIDLYPNLMGEAAVEPSVIPHLSGTFDGNGFVISNLTLTGFDHLGLIGTIEEGGLVQNLGVVNANIAGNGDRIGIIAGSNNGTVSNSYSTGMVSGRDSVGGLVGHNEGTITLSYSTGAVTGDQDIGGLVGWGGWINGGSITMSYSTGPVNGNDEVGGLVGFNDGTITSSYSTGTVTGYGNVGGLVGDNRDGSITLSFWDMETSGQTTSDGGEGKTTAEMQTASTFLDAGWDFMDETANGTDDIWSICEGTNYPKLVWQISPADFVCPDGITMEDFDFFMDHWEDVNCDQSNGYCDGTDLDFSGTVDIDDFAIMLDYWLAEAK